MNHCRSFSANTLGKDDDEAFERLRKECSMTCGLFLRQFGSALEAQSAFDDCSRVNKKVVRMLAICQRIVKRRQIQIRR